jgi:ubiquinone/menaquinone biosynthesis C-methylase UbiE
MKQQALVAKQFGDTANAYLTSSIHSQGADLQAIRGIVSRFVNPRILDLGCGAGHVSFVVAPHAKAVTAYDLSDEMLAVVAHSAQQRGLQNIGIQKGMAETLPFEDGAFDLVLSRFSAHHWLDVPAALAEINRVLTPNGAAVFVDIVAPESPMNDTILQTAEVLRDASHVRDYRVSEWARMFAAAGFEHACKSSWKLLMEFDDWIKRMRTPQVRVDAIRDLFDRAPQESVQYFSVQDDHSFSIDAALFEIGKRGPAN